MTIFIVLWQKIRRHQILFLFILALLTLFIGAGLFASAEHTTFFTALYWAVTTATTVGYGDVIPHNTAGRLIAMGVMLTTIPLMGAVFAAWAAGLASLHIRRLLGLEHNWTHGHDLVIYGYSPTVANLLPDLVQAHRSILLVADVDSSLIPQEVQLMAGDATNTHVVEKSAPHKAKKALIAGNTDGEVLLTAIALRHLAPALPIMAMTQSTKVAQALKDLGVEYTVATDNLMGQTIAKSLETPHAADLLLSILGSDRYRLSEDPVADNWVGLPLSQLRREFSGILLGLVHNSEVILGVERDPVVASGDHVLYLTPTTKPS
ncbi:voltage-gated potassium channel [Sulfobacillus thermosulfidooxidans DSM 9293]|uniref:Voltage-gated potassium channel n=1 Tax=Sulfobacillus thermosulfidooxidans (strain DSM 9293 / VKM B-1269 / AT-1) TaxID=929705 RepID=A0A1W1W7E1_SULTA|nr:potassium channel family protein [Sulfobacillus thermosulfidooxidans]SMC02112.1 voltage-gated potassium channel [Sulfobacillus thermosulfidooxidans DSM 9293]